MPSQAERTHEWDVSDTNWDLYPVGTHHKLTCPDFSCGGLDDLSTDFHPRGFQNSEDFMTLFLTKSKENRPQLIATWQFRLESKGFPTKTLDCYGDMSKQFNTCVCIPCFKGVVGVDKISAIAMCVEHKYQPEDVQQVPCIKGDMLRVVADRKTAEESCFVVGCENLFELSHRNHLGQIGKVVAVERLSIQLKHRDGALLWWGHLALLPGFTSAEVDAMKVCRSNRPLWRPECTMHVTSLLQLPV